MSNRHKILLLDDDQELLELYREMLERLPSQPEIHTATSGARAIALLESDEFTLLVSDLNMPRMDGLQVLTIVRRKFPHLRTAVMTSIVDAQFRARAYAMGVDLYLEKPNTSQEITFFLDCIESLLGREVDGGFRGVQSKSLVDIIQLECLSGSSSVLKVTNGTSDGRIWFQDGNLIDSEAPELQGRDAFAKILSWKTGNFEILPPDPSRERTIFESVQGLLLESVQAVDEALAEAQEKSEAPDKPAEEIQESPSTLAALSRFNGVQFALSVPFDGNHVENWGSESPDLIGRWARKTMTELEQIGDAVQTGQLNQVQAFGPNGHLVLFSRSNKTLCVGFHRSLSQEIVRETMTKIVNAWES